MRYSTLKLHKITKPGNCDSAIAVIALDNIVDTVRCDACVQAQGVKMICDTRIVCNCPAIRVSECPLGNIIKTGVVVQNDFWDSIGRLK